MQICHTTLTPSLSAPLLRPQLDRLATSQNSFLLSCLSYHNTMKGVSKKDENTMRKRNGRPNNREGRLLNDLRYASSLLSLKLLAVCLLNPYMLDLNVGSLGTVYNRSMNGWHNPKRRQIWKHFEAEKKAKARPTKLTGARVNLPVTLVHQHVLFHASCLQWCYTKFTWYGRNERSRRSVEARYVIVIMLLHILFWGRKSSRRSLRTVW